MPQIYVHCTSETILIRDFLPLRLSFVLHIMIKLWARQHRHRATQTWNCVTEHREFHNIKIRNNSGLRGRFMTYVIIIRSFSERTKSSNISQELSEMVIPDHELKEWRLGMIVVLCSNNYCAIQIFGIILYLSANVEIFVFYWPVSVTCACRDQWEATVNVHVRCVKVHVQCQ